MSSGRELNSKNARLKGSANLSLFQNQHVTFPLRMSGRAERDHYLLEWLGGGLFVSGGEARHQPP